MPSAVATLQLVEDHESGVAVILYVIVINEKEKMNGDSIGP
jgi:hypothetical protein